MEEIKHQITDAAGYITAASDAAWICQSQRVVRACQSGVEKGYAVDRAGAGAEEIRECGVGEAGINARIRIACQQRHGEVARERGDGVESNGNAGSDHNGTKAAYWRGWFDLIHEYGAVWLCGFDPEGSRDGPYIRNSRIPAIP